MNGRATAEISLSTLLIAAAACHGDRARKGPAAQPSGSAPTAPLAELRSVSIAPPCQGAVADVPADAPTELRLASATTICASATPELVCTCLARDMSQLGDGFEAGPADCEFAPATTPSARVARVRSKAEHDGIVSGSAYVAILRDAREWAVRAVASAMPDIDLDETPQLSADARLVSVQEARFADGIAVWVQTTDTERDRTGDEADVEVSVSLTLCAMETIGSGFQCGRLPLASWVATQDGDGACRSAAGSSFQAVQASLESLSYQRAGDDAPPLRVSLRLAHRASQ